MDNSLATYVEAMLRIVLGLRFLYSGVSNIVRWPHAIGTARVVFSVGAPFFGFMGVLFMTVGGAGLVLGVQTQICAVLIAVFLLPTFVVHVHWRRTFPSLVADLAGAVARDDLRPTMAYIGKHAIHAHDVGWQDNLVFLVLTLYFAVRSETALALDNLLY